MHEIGLMQSALDMAFERMQSAGAERVLALRFKVGPLSGVVPEALEFAFEALSQGTAAEGGRLEIEKVGVVCYCFTCRIEYELQEIDYTCPHCEGTSIELRSGSEFELTSLEVSEDV